MSEVFGSRKHVLEQKSQQTKVRGQDTFINPGPDIIATVTQLLLDTSNAMSASLNCLATSAFNRR